MSACRSVRGVGDERDAEGKTVVHQRRLQVPQPAQRTDGEAAQHRHQLHPLPQAQPEDGRPPVRGRPDPVAAPVLGHDHRPRTDAAG